jgi:hypothetical protein
VKKDEQLENPTVDKMRRVMSLVYKSGMRYGLIPRNEASNPLRFVRCKTTITTIVPCAGAISAVAGKEIIEEHLDGVGGGEGSKFIVVFFVQQRFR